MGRIQVLSSLGEPLKAEIDILDINADEAATLSTKVASPETFKAAGLEYSSIMAGVRTSLNRRADGRTYIQLSSSQRISDPFVDLIIETRWSSGRIVRDYTLLFDPPKLNAAAPAPVAPGVTTQAATPASAVASNLAPMPGAASSAKKPPQSATGSTTITVKAGDTASKIAAQNLAPNLSLDQMLVALLRANPNAFVQQNVNLIKSGAVITLPSAEQAQGVAPDEARQIITAQSRDFNQYRQSLAANAPTTELAPAERSAAGPLQAQVSDKKSAAVAPDKLTLSKASVQGKSDEQQLAKTGNAQELAQRTDEVARNIQELDKLASATQASAAASAASAEQAPPKPVAVPKPAALPATAAPEPSFIDALLDNPLLPAGAASLTVLLAGLGWYRVRQRNKSAPAKLGDLAENRLQPESFFGVSDIKNVDVRDNPPTGSSMLYSPSQLDAVDEFDPVAEAAVYMAYGRDQQAEEILKEALNETPDRLSIHRKLLEIYAKRHDAKAFETIAILASGLTKGRGTDWDSICTLGQTVDPGNALYRPDSTPSQPATQPAISEFPRFTAATQVMPLEPLMPESDKTPAVDLELDLDELAAGAAAEAALNQPSEASPPLAADAASTLDELAQSLDFSLPELPTDRMPLADDQAASGSGTAATAPKSMLDFDLGELSLELHPPAETPASGTTVTETDSLESKLALAEEYRAIGDEESARALIEEVIAAAAADDVKTKAQKALDQS